MPKAAACLYGELGKCHALTCSCIANSFSDIHFNIIWYMLDGVAGRGPVRGSNHELQGPVHFVLLY